MRFEDSHHFEQSARDIQNEWMSLDSEWSIELRSSRLSLTKEFPKNIQSVVSKLECVYELADQGRDRTALKLAEELLDSVKRDFCSKILTEIEREVILSANQFTLGLRLDVLRTKRIQRKYSEILLGHDLDSDIRLDIAALLRETHQLADAVDEARRLNILLLEAQIWFELEERKSAIAALDEALSTPGIADRQRIVAAMICTINSLPERSCALLDEVDADALTDDRARFLYFTSLSIEVMESKNIDVAAAISHAERALLIAQCHEWTLRVISLSVLKADLLGNAGKFDRCAETIKYLKSRVEAINADSELIASLGGASYFAIGLVARLPWRVASATPREDAIAVIEESIKCLEAVPGSLIQATALSYIGAELEIRRSRKILEIETIKSLNRVRSNVAVIFGDISESGGLVDLLSNKHFGKTDYYTANCGLLNGRGVIVVETGTTIGAAANATRSVIKNHKPIWIIAAGFAHSLKEEIRERDIVIVDDVVNLEGELIHTGINVNRGSIAAMPGWHVGKAISIHDGYSTDHEKQRLATQFGAIIRDSRAYDIARACKEAGKNCMIVLCVSAGGPEQWARGLKRFENAKTWGEQVFGVLEVAMSIEKSVLDLWKIDGRVFEATKKLARGIQGMIKQLPPSSP